MICDVQEEAFFEVLSVAFVDPSELDELDPARRRLVAHLNGLVLEVAVWTQLDESEVQTELGCKQTRRQLLFETELRVLEDCIDYVSYARDMSLAAPTPDEGRTTLTGAVEVFRRVRRNTENARAAMTEPSDLLGASALEFVIKGDASRAMLAALSSSALRDCLDLGRFPSEVEERVLGAVRSSVV